MDIYLSLSPFAFVLSLALGLIIPVGIIILILQNKRARQTQTVGDFLRLYLEVQEKLLLAEHEVNPSRQGVLKAQQYRALFSLHFGAYLLREKKSFEDTLYSHWLEERKTDFEQSEAYQNAWKELKDGYPSEFQDHLNLVHRGEFTEALYRRNWEDSLDETLGEMSKKGLTGSLIDGISLKSTPK